MYHHSRSYKAGLATIRLSEHFAAPRKNCSANVWVYTVN